jgi:SAM-dependent methyltransferase
MAFLDGEAYLKFMGRFSVPLAAVFADWSGLPDTGTVLDVGCGPGVLTEELVRRYGAEQVKAIDPSPAFVATLQNVLPDVDVQLGVAEQLPYGTNEFDAALAQLVVHFMADPVAGLAEMRRVTRPGGVVTACVWDHSGERGPLSQFWAAVRATGQPDDDETGRAGVREGHLAQLFTEAGLTDVRDGHVDVTVPFATFEDWWEPFTMGVGPAGDHVAGLDDAGRERLREECRRRLPDPPFELTASAWAAAGRP